MEKAIRPELAHVVADLYASEINGTFGWLWDTGYFVALGTVLNPEDEFEAKTVVTTLDEAADWLRTEAIRLYPESNFARKHTGGLQ
jgi:hypothetical protein